MPEAAAHRIPGLRGEQVVDSTPQEAARHLTRTLACHLKQRLARLSRVHIALSGGSSARLLCAALGAERLLSDSEWAEVHVWMVDERCVADGDPRLNAGLLRELLLPRVPLPSGNLHPMPVLIADGARQYEDAIRVALDARPMLEDRRLDAVILGMGTDGHTASLFPQTPALDERKRLVVVNDGEQVAPPRPRLTMTYPLINRAALIALLVTGAEKRDALAAVATHPNDFRARPVTGIVPDPAASLFWFLDQEAFPGTPDSPSGSDATATSLSG